jgi:hypothetical protein
MRTTLPICSLLLLAGCSNRSSKVGPFNNPDNDTPIVVADTSTIFRQADGSIDKVPANVVYAPGHGELIVADPGAILHSVDQSVCVNGCRGYKAGTIEGLPDGSTPNLKKSKSWNLTLTRQDASTLILSSGDNHEVTVDFQKKSFSSAGDGKLTNSDGAYFSKVSLTIDATPILTDYPTTPGSTKITVHYCKGSC